MTEAADPDPSGVASSAADSSKTPSERPRSRVVDWRRQGTAYGLLAVVAVIHLALAWQRRWVQEDGFINIRVASQVLAGHGPVFNIGERVEAFTSPLWLATLVVVRVATFGLVPYEWLAVVIGIALSVAGTVALMAGAVTLLAPRRPSRNEVWLPFGILALVAVSPLWDFSSSGLENGLAQGWLGCAFLVVARAATAPARRRTLDLRWASALLGLGPLVRPELGLYAIGAAVALWVCTIRPRRRAGLAVPSTIGMVAAGLAIPVGYELFRMGY